MRAMLTEINAGRLLSGAAIFDATGVHNMTCTYVQLGLGLTPSIRHVYDSPDGLYMSATSTRRQRYLTSGFWRGWVDAR
jgi:hypothetical protein